MPKERDYKKEYRDFHGKPEEIKKRTARGKARRKLKEKGIDVSGKDVDHIDHNPNNNAVSNLRVRSVSANRADNKHKSKRRKH